MLLKITTEFKHMEKRLNAKIDVWTTDFKGALAGKIQLMEMADDAKAPLLQFIYDYGHLVVKKEDIQKRTRVKNLVPFHERCRALRANGEQCTRRKKDCAKFCGTHIKGIPHGEISDAGSKESLLKKVQVWVQEVNGIIRHIDKTGNVYDPQDIYQNIENPKVIAKWTKTGDKYQIH
jgi:hypothetical protein